MSNLGLDLSTSSYEGWGQCKSSGAEQNTIFLSKDVEYCVVFSHTLDNVGSHLVTSTLQEFGNRWVRLFHSYRAKLAGKDLTGRKPKSYSGTRWW